MSTVLNATSGGDERDTGGHVLLSEEQREQLCKNLGKAFQAYDVSLVAAVKVLVNHLFAVSCSQPENHEMECALIARKVAFHSVDYADEKLNADASSLVRELSAQISPSGIAHSPRAEPTLRLHPVEPSATNSNGKDDSYPVLSEAEIDHIATNRLSLDRDGVAVIALLLEHVVGIASGDGTFGDLEVAVVALERRLLRSCDPGEPGNRNEIAEAELEKLRDLVLQQVRAEAAGKPCCDDDSTPTDPRDCVRVIQRQDVGGPPSDALYNLLVFARKTGESGGPIENATLDAAMDAVWASSERGDNSVRESTKAIEVQMGFKKQGDAD